MKHSHFILTASLFTLLCVGCEGPHSYSSKPGNGSPTSTSGDTTTNPTNTTAGTTNTTAGTTAPAADGASLYASTCASCHGPLATSQRKGATADAIEAARTNPNHTAWASTLSKDAVIAIAGALK